ncbi:TPA: hypothetical protein ACSTLY_003986 [Serratia fonticola]
MNSSITRSTVSPKPSVASSITLFVLYSSLTYEAMPLWERPHHRLNQLRDVIALTGIDGDITELTSIELVTEKSSNFSEYKG